MHFNLDFPNCILILRKKNGNFYHICRAGDNKFNVNSFKMKLDGLVDLPKTKKNKK